MSNKLELETMVQDKMITDIFNILLEQIVNNTFTFNRREGQKASGFKAQTERKDDFSDLEFLEDDLNVSIFS